MIFRLVTFEVSGAAITSPVLKASTFTTCIVPCEPHTGIEPFGRLVAQVMARNPIVRYSEYSGWYIVARRIAALPPSSDC